MYTHLQKDTDSHLTHPCSATAPCWRNLHADASSRNPVEADTKRRSCGSQIERKRRGRRAVRIHCSSKVRRLRERKHTRYKFLPVWSNAESDMTSKLARTDVWRQTRAVRSWRRNRASSQITDQQRHRPEEQQQPYQMQVFHCQVVVDPTYRESLSAIGERTRRKAMSRIT